MIKINLLPHEPESFSFLKSLTFLLIITLFLIGGSVGGIYFYQNSRIELLSKRIKILNNDTSSSKIKDDMRNYNRIEKDIKKIESHLNMINNLADENMHWALILNDISDLLPEDIWITDIKGDKEKLSISGNSLSEESVNNFLQNLRKSIFYKKVESILVQETVIDSKSKPVSTFKIIGTLKPLANNL